MKILLPAFLASVLCITCSHFVTAFLAGDVSQLCALCGPAVNVTVTARNELVKPTFDVTVTLHNTPQRELIYLLERAADKDPRFNFTASYQRGWGFFIEAINGRRGDFAKDGTWWFIYSQRPGTGALCQGASSHVPFADEWVIFNFTNNFEDLPKCPEAQESRSTKEPALRHLP